MKIQKIKRHWIEKTLNSAMILVLMGVLAAAYYHELFRHQTPCPLCRLQRLGMMGVAFGAFLNVKVGLKIRHYAFALLSLLIGGSVSIRQILLHICPGFPRFGIPVLGLNLYTWALIVFACSFFAIIVLLGFYRPNDESVKPKLNWFDWCAIIALIVLIVANAITTLASCGFGFCEDPSL